MRRLKEGEEPYKELIARCWIGRTGGPGGNLTTAKLSPEEIEKFIEFSKKPCRLVVYRLQKKAKPEQPDGVIYLYRWDDEWKEKNKAAKEKSLNKEKITKAVKAIKAKAEVKKVAKAKKEKVVVATIEEPF